MCDCIQAVNRALQEGRNGDHLKVMTHIKSGEKKACVAGSRPNCGAMANFCPFCGTKYDSAFENTDMVQLIQRLK